MIRIYHYNFLKISRHLPQETFDSALHIYISRLGISNEVFWYPDNSAIQILGQNSIDVFENSELMIDINDQDTDLCYKRRILNGPKYTIWFPSLTALEKKCSYLYNNDLYFDIMMWESRYQYWDDVKSRFRIVPNQHTDQINRCTLQHTPVNIIFKKELTSRQLTEIISVLKKWYCCTRIDSVFEKKCPLIPDNSILVYDKRISFELNLQQSSQESFNFFILQLTNISAIALIDSACFTPYFSTKKVIDEQIFTSIADKYRSNYSIVEAMKLTRSHENEFTSIKCITFEEYFKPFPSKSIKQINLIEIT